ncbi:MAG TPA: TadE family protein [Caulobacteraceae bacterium]
MCRSLLREEAASAAVEFALVVPVLFTAILGIISTSALYFSGSALHMAAESAARYWAVSDSGWSISSSCTFTAPVGTSGLSLPVACTKAGTDTGDGYFDPATYAQKHYFGVALTGLTFTPSTGNCTSSSGTYGGPGVIVSATATYTFNALFVNYPVSLQSQACYPIIE